LQRRMGTMCAMYGWLVEATAEAIEPISRSLRLAAMRRRRAVMRRAAGAVPGVGFCEAVSGCASTGMQLLFYRAGVNQAAIFSGRTGLRFAWDACQKSCVFCILNQISEAPCPNASLNLIDI